MPATLGVGSVQTPVARSGGGQPETKTVSGTTTTDSVDLSPLASALKGDALALFTKLSPDDRTTLSDFVSSGRMSAEEVNDALTDKLKVARKESYWKGVVEAEGRRNDHIGKEIDSLTKELEEKLAAIEKAGSPAAALALAMKQKEDMDRSRFRLSSLIGQSISQPVNPNSKLTMDFAVTKIARSETERAAGSKLASLGFGSESFAQLLKDTAAADVAAQRGATRKP
ncbi:MAG TPA: hypothetical protein VD995_05270 [Azospirillum sp.]|nr:hypothetical protein [Azospirillum sp.]